MLEVSAARHTGAGQHQWHRTSLEAKSSLETLSALAKDTRPSNDELSQRVSLDNDWHCLMMSMDRRKMLR